MHEAPKALCVNVNVNVNVNALQTPECFPSPFLTDSFPKLWLENVTWSWILQLWEGSSRKRWKNKVKAGFCHAAGCGKG